MRSLDEADTYSDLTFRTLTRARLALNDANRALVRAHERGEDTAPIVASI